MGRDRELSRSPTTTICARPACWGSACRRPRRPGRRLRDLHDGGGRDRPLLRRHGADLQHARLFDDVDRRARRRARHDPEQRAEHERPRELHFKRVVRDGAVYAQPFSEGSAAAAGNAPFGTPARKVEGGWLVNGSKIFASLVGRGRLLRRAVHRGQGRPEPDVRDTLYLAVPADAPGFSISGDWDPLGMRGTVSRNLAVQGRVRAR